MKQDNSFSAVNVVQKLLQTLTQNSSERKPLATSTAILHDEDYFEVEISEHNLPTEISDLRQSLGQLEDGIGRYSSIMRELRYLLRA